MKNRAKANLPAAILMLCLLMIWQGAAMGVDAAYILPSPVQVVQKLWELRVPLFTAHLPATMEVVGVGLVISIVLGLGLAILMDVSPVAEKALYPIVIASQTIPTTALAPLFVLWFGYSLWSKVLGAVLMTFFPITITVFDGFRSVKTEMIELMQTFGASRRTISSPASSTFARRRRSTRRRMRSSPSRAVPRAACATRSRPSTSSFPSRATR